MRSRVSLTEAQKCNCHSHSWTAPAMAGGDDITAIFAWSTAGIVTVTEMDYDKSSLTLTCTSTGGPATTVTWTKDGAPLTDKATYQQSQTITDTLTATYENRLSIITRSDSVSGDYACTVQNSNSEASSPEISVTGKKVCMCRHSVN